MNMLNEDSWITRNENEEYDSPPLKPAPWAFADLYLIGHDSSADFDVIVKQEDCTALMWAFILTQRSFEEKMISPKNVLFIKKYDGKWNLVEPKDADAYLTPWTVCEDRLGHYKACQELSEKHKTIIYPAFLAE